MFFSEFGFICNTCKEKYNIDIAICLMCAHRCHNGHKVTPIGYQILDCRCNNSINVCKAKDSLVMPNHVKNINLSNTNISYPNEYELMHCKVYQSNQFLLTSLDLLSIQAKTPICYLSNVRENNMIIENTVEETAGYYEVEILSGGFYDQLAFGLTNNENFPVNEFVGYTSDSIGYHGDDGKCFINGMGFTYGTRFGAKDVIGCGVTRSGNVYYTHNGCILPTLDFKLKGNIFPLVSLRGEHSCVKIIHDPGAFKFKHKKVHLYRDPGKEYNFTNGFCKLLTANDKLLEKIQSIALHYKNNNEIGKKFKAFSKILNKLGKKFNKREVLKYCTLTEESHTTGISGDKNTNTFFENEQQFSKNQHWAREHLKKPIFDPNDLNKKQQIEKEGDITPVKHRGAINVPNANNNSNLILSSLQNSSQQSSFIRKQGGKCHNACGPKCLIF
jgi:hypothetical protein